MEKFAHAKINLYLRVLGCRPDGFHEIESLIAPISLADSIVLQPANEFEFRCSDPALPTGEDNLVVRAAQLFFAHTNVASGVRITLEKKIPHGAGLGGGSSDAATTLIALDSFFRTEMNGEQFNALAEQLGSDVPFFLVQQAAVCRGRGEIVERTDLPVQFNVVLLKPQFAVATQWAYSRWHQSRGPTLPDCEAQQLKGITFANDLERPVFQKFVFLATLKSWLLGQPEVAIALMSGSGSSMFAVIKNGASAQGLITRAREQVDPALWACACQTIH